MVRMRMVAEANEQTNKSRHWSFPKIASKQVPNSPTEVVLLFFGRGIIAIEVDWIVRIGPSGIVVHVPNTPWGRVLEGSVLFLVTIFR